MVRAAAHRNLLVEISAGGVQSRWNALSLPMVDWNSGVYYGLCAVEHVTNRLTLGVSLSLLVVAV